MAKHSSSTLKALEGVFPAIVSPHDGSGRFDEAGFERQVRFLYESDIQGLYVCGGTGEGYLMRVDERKAAAEVAVAASAGNGRVIVHVGAQATRDAVELADHAAKCGAHAVASIPPLGREGRELIGWYTDLVAASSLPVFVYHIPGVTGRALSVDQLSELMAIPGVAGLKFTHSDLFLLSRLLRRHPTAIIYNGSDEMVAPGLLYGARGAIGTWYNLCPRVFADIYKAAANGDIADAFSLQRTFNQLADIAWQHDVLRSFEMLMRRLGVVKHVWRAPFRPFDRQEERAAWQQLRPHCKRLGLNL